MKKTLLTLLIALLVLGLAACSAPAATPTPSAEATQVTAVVTFEDPVLEIMVRGAIGQPDGDITAAKAGAVTRLDLNDELRRRVSGEEAITNLGGLEYFQNLDSLDLTNHAITDISPLADLQHLTSLSLGGNPVADLTPLAGLTNLKGLILSGSAAEDYSALTSLVNLEILMLDNSLITDVSPLAGLTNLRNLYLANCPVNDYSPLTAIYPNLEDKDFILASTLKELGFVMDNGSHLAIYDDEDAYVKIHHSAWGPPPEEWETNMILTSMYLEGGQKLGIGYYSDLGSYVIMMDAEGQPPINYVYDTRNSTFTFRSGDRTSSEQAIRAALDIEEGEDPLLAPIRIFNDKIRENFHMTADALYAMPYEPPTFKSLGFVLDENTGNFVYEQHEGIYTNIQINRAEGIEKEFDVVFFQPISDEYRVNVAYYVANKKFHVQADDNDQGGASYKYFMDTGEHIDEWCSDPDKTVEDYFINAYNDPEIEDIYLHSVELMDQYISDTFGMTIEELYSLPTGE